MSIVFKVKIRKIGTSAGVLIPKSVMKAERLKIGDDVELSVVLPIAEREKLIKQALGMAKGLGPFKREKAEFDRF